MNNSFVEFLNSVKADPDMIQQALRVYLSERTNDLTRNEMVSELRASAGNPEQVDQFLRSLERDPDALEEAALLYFQQAWEDDTEVPRIRAAFESAKARLPVVEAAILAVVAMYAMHLIATKGVTERIKKNPDGSYERTKLEPFVPIVSAVAKLFAKNS